MSSFVLDQEEINILTEATGAMLRLNKKYPGSYPLSAATIETLGKYADDPHNIYRALYITNIKAVNSRYGDDAKTLPKYNPVRAWNIDNLNIDQMKKAAGKFGCYMYQCSEDPIYGGPAFNAFYDVYKLLCMIIVKKTVDWD